MTTIEQIKDALQVHIAEAEAATPGPWITCEHSWQETSILTESRKGERHIGLLSIPDDERKQQKLGKLMDANATFIAHARTMSPAACKCLLLAIEGMERHEAHIALESIRQEWHNLTTK